MLAARARSVSTAPRWNSLRVSVAWGCRSFGGSFSIRARFVQSHLLRKSDSMALFESGVAVACPAEKAWDFLVRPANLKLITPPEVGLHLVEAPEVLELGSKLLFKVQAWGQVQQF